MSNVVKLDVIQGGGSPVPVNRVLASARATGLTDVVVLGYDADGCMCAFASHGAGDTLWLIEQGKKWLLEGCPAD